MFLKEKRKSLQSSPPVGLAFTKANKLYISSIKTSEVEDHANLLESIESWNFDEDENINKTALIDVGIGDDHSTTDWPFPRLIRNQNESIFAFKIWPEIST